MKGIQLATMQNVSLATEYESVTFTQKQNSLLNSENPVEP